MWDQYILPANLPDFLKLSLNFWPSSLHGFTHWVSLKQIFHTTNNVVLKGTTNAVTNHLGYPWTNFAWYERSFWQLFAYHFHINLIKSPYIGHQCDGYLRLGSISPDPLQHNPCKLPKQSYQCTAPSAEQLPIGANDTSPSLPRADFYANTPPHFLPPQRQPQHLQSLFSPNPPPAAEHSITFLTRINICVHLRWRMMDCCQQEEEE